MGLGTAPTESPVKAASWQTDTLAAGQVGTGSSSLHLELGTVGLGHDPHSLPVAAHAIDNTCTGSLNNVRLSSC